MTNVDKYLKDNKVVQDFIKEISRLIAKCVYDAEVNNNTDYIGEICNWLDTEETPTEDEMVILRNVNEKYTTIGRNTEGDLIVGNNGIDWEYISAFNHLFHFIKNGEEYEIAELLKGE